MRKDFKCNKTAYVLLLFCIVPLCSGFANVLISPTNQQINYYGRFNTTDTANPAFNWSGAIIEAQFPGPTIGMKISHPNAYYDIEIDGVIDTVIKCGSTQQYIFSTKLSTAMHSLRIMLRSEDHYTRGVFQGLYLADGKSLGTAPAKPSHKIEFIGDSFTSGYGVESSTRDCSSPDALNKSTNVNRSFAGLVTKAFHAQSIILGWSGAGMVRNYGAPTKRSTDPYPIHYDQTLGAITDGGTWDFKKWIPDLVVICLGTNDFSTTPYPDDSMYVGDYHKLISRITTNYPTAKIGCLATTDANIKRLVAQIVTEEHGTLNHPQVFSIAFPLSVENTACDWHPSLNDDRNIAKGIIDTTMKKLSWDTSAVTVTLSNPVHPMYVSPKISAHAIASGFQITAEASSAGQPVYLFTIGGREINRSVLDNLGNDIISTASLPSGMYVIGSMELGWTKVAVAVSMAGRM